MGNLDEVMPNDDSAEDQDTAADESHESESDASDDSSEEEDKSSKKGSRKGVGKRGRATAPEAAPRSPTVSKDTTPAIADLIERNQLGLTEKAKKMKAHLASQETVSTMIPLGPGENLNSVMDFSLNGFSFSVPKGRYIHVPRQIADMIMDSLGADQRTLQQHSLNLANAGAKAKAALNA